LIINYIERQLYISVFEDISDEPEAFYLLFEYSYLQKYK